MVRIPKFWRRSPAPTTQPSETAPAVEAIGPGLALGAGFLIENGSDGLRLHVPQVSLSTERLAALVVEPGERGPMLAYRVFDPTTEPYDMHWSEGSSGGLLGHESVKEKLAEAAAVQRPLDRRLVDAGFEPVADGIWRHRLDDGTFTAVLRDGEVNFYTPARDFGMEDVIRGSELSGVVELPLDSGSRGLRLNGEWMSYTLVQPVTYPRDAQMTRPVTRAELGLPKAPQSAAPGEHETERILGLTEIGGRPVPELEAWMRPFDPDRPSEPIDYNRSQAGFLGPRDDLRRTMARDNEVVRRLGLTHADLATAAENATEVSARFGVKDYVGPGHHRYRIEMKASMGIQPSPFQDGTAGSNDYRVTNKQTGSAVNLSDLTAALSRRGFYQGPGTPYRAAPEDIVRTFAHLAEAAGGEEEIARVVTEVDAFFSAADAVDRSSTAAEHRPPAQGVANPVRPDGRSQSSPRRAPEVRER